MQSAPPDLSQTASTAEFSSSSPTPYHDGLYSDRQPTPDSLPHGRLVRESSDLFEDDVSVTSTATSRGRRSGNTGWLNQGGDDSSQEGSPGGRVDAYERANHVPRRTSETLVFQVTPSKDASQDSVKLMDFPNEVLTHILSHLPPENLSMMSLVNNRFHKLVTTPPAWRIAFARFFPGPESTGLTTSTPVDIDVEKAQRRSFTRLGALASWRSEYILRTRLLRSVARARPAIQAAVVPGSSKHKAAAQATMIYGSSLMYPVSHIHANFGVGLNKKQPLFVHGAVEQGVVSSSDPATGKTGSWGLADFEAFKHFADVYTGETEYGLGTGDIVGMPNVIDVSQAYGKLYGEACPGGRLFYTNTGEQRGRFLIVGSMPKYELGIPHVSMTEACITSVWLAKTEAVLKLTSGLVGALAGYSSGILSAYAVGSTPVYDRRFERGELTARWAICPGVPIVSISVDEKFSTRRLARKRIWATVLNALGEVFYLTEVPSRIETKGRLSEMELDHLAWQTGRSVEWHMLELTRRKAKPDPYGTSVVDGSYTPRSSCASQGLHPAQYEAEAREIEQYLKKKPKDFQTLCDGWDMRRGLLVDYGGLAAVDGGESIVVVSKGGGEAANAQILRFTRECEKLSVHIEDESPPAFRDTSRNSIFGGTPTKPERLFSSSPPSTLLSRTSSHDDLQNASCRTNWYMSNASLGTLKNTTISAMAIDESDLAVLAAFEDPLLGMTGGSDTSSPLSSPFGNTGSNTVSNASEIPGQRSRLFGVGTTSGTVLLWDARATRSIQPDIVNTILPVRIIYTRSPQISSLALSSLYVVHGGNDGLVQAWDPLASTTDPIRTLNSRFSDRARRRIAQAENTMHGVGHNYFAAGAVVLDPDPTVLRGMVSLGTQLLYWSYSASAADAYKTRKRGQLRKRSDKGVSGHGLEQKYHHSGRRVIESYIDDERYALEYDDQTRQKETQKLKQRYGADVLGPDATEEEILQYAMLVSQEAHDKEESKRLLDVTQPAGSSKSIKAEREQIEHDVEEAIRLSLLETDLAQEVPQDFDIGHQIPIRTVKGKGSKTSTPKKSQNQTKQMPGSRSESKSQEDQDLEFALQLSMAEQESARLADENEYPTLSRASSGEIQHGKGKGRRHRS